MKQTLSLKLKMGEIIYDVQNKTYLTGKSLENGENHAHVANVQANDDDENAAQVLRSITMAAAVLRNRLSEFMGGSASSATNDIMKETDDVVFTLAMPSNFNTAVAQTLGEAAHQFIVATAIADWFAITAKGETTDYSVTAEASMKVIEEALCKRNRPIRVEE